MVNYRNGLIYKIVSKYTDLCYVGSTTQSLSKRLSQHRSEFKNGGKSCSSKEILKYGDVNIILIEKYPCDDKMELTKQERFHIERLNCVNKCIPGRTLKEYYIDNKDRIKLYRQENFLAESDV